MRDQTLARRSTTVTTPVAPKAAGLYGEVTTFLERHEDRRDPATDGPDQRPVSRRAALS